MLPRIDHFRRKKQHTDKAIAVAQSLPATPVLLEIFYPSLLAQSPPSYYRVDKGFATPISREQSNFDYVQRITFLPNGDFHVG